MLKLDIPGLGAVQIDHLVLDYNGTIAEGGIPVPGVLERLQELSRILEIHVITADTFSSAASRLTGYPLRFFLIPPGNQDAAKRAFVESLDASRVVAVGNGFNDALMLQVARIGIAVIMKEGLSVRSLQEADLVVRDIVDALDLLLHPQGLV
ncbi:ATPase P, partial [Desulfococcaceae bacterium OttesenSCG-928-F15]|nr:ATPase P [Desulfococcaceae bacterium OttesenSCG-928-F15]